MERIMTIREVSAKIDTRLNKGASGDYDNIWSYQKQEAFNKAVIDWVRRQKRGKNMTQEGDEETDARTDDLQVLLVANKPLAVRNKGLYVQTSALPTDYLYYKRLTPKVTAKGCQSVHIKSHLREEANVDDLLNLPSFEFEETFHTLVGNKAHVYHNKKFKIESVDLTYYRLPKKYDFKKLDTVIEFKRDVCEMFVDETCKILASDLESINQKTLAQERSEGNN